MLWVLLTSKPDTPNGVALKSYFLFLILMTFLIVTAAISVSGLIVYLAIKYL